MEKRISDWIESLEFEFGRDGDTAYCATGDAFDTIAWTPSGAHVKPEGDPTTDFDTPELAFEMFICAFERYVKDRQGLLYWRKRPEIFEVQYYPNYERYFVIARIFMSKTKRQHPQRSNTLELQGKPEMRPYEHA